METINPVAVGLTLLLGYGIIEGLKGFRKGLRGMGSFFRSIHEDLSGDLEILRKQPLEIVIKRMDEREFERYVAEQFRRLPGWHVVHNGRAGDNGIDILAQAPSGRRWAIQVKKRSNDKPEGVEGVRSLAGAMKLMRISHGIFITTAPNYTAPAISNAKRTNIELWGMDELRRLVEEGKI